MNTNGFAIICIFGQGFYLLVLTNTEYKGHSQGSLSQIL